MLAFCGQERCILEKNGRLRLCRGWVDDFLRRCSGEVVMHGLPEGALALYPEEVYREMRARELGDLDAVGMSFAARRSLRRFGALTRTDRITPQGRVLIPEPFREYAGLIAGAEVCVVGVEIGLEIWSPERFAAEMDATAAAMKRRAEEEFAGGGFSPDQHGGEQR